QTETFQLITRLCDRGYQVLIETSGAIDISPVDRRAPVIFDVKSSGSGMTEPVYLPKLHVLTMKNEAKIFFCGPPGYDWARNMITHYELTGRCPVLMSPVFGSLEPRLLAEWVLADRLPVRFQLQLHKFIWAPDMRGV